MPVSIDDSQFEDSDLKRGIYPATFVGFVKDELLDPGRYNFLPRAILKFEIQQQDATATMFCPANERLVSMIHTITGSELLRADLLLNPHELYEWAKGVAVNARWNGLVRVDYRGSIDGIALKQGFYKFRWGGFETRDPQTGEVTHYTSQQYDNNRAVYRLVVAEGPMKGVDHVERMSVSYKYGSGGMLSLHQNSSLYKLLIAGGVTQEIFDNLEFEVGEEPLPKFAQVLENLAAQGRLIGATVNDESRIKMDTLVALDDQGPEGTELVLYGGSGKPVRRRAPANGQLEKQVIQRVDFLTQMISGDPNASMVKPNGQPTDAGMDFGRQVLKPLAGGATQLGIEANWPPSNWGDQGMENAKIVFEAMTELDSNELKALISNDDDLVAFAVTKVEGPEQEQSQKVSF
jgi:hypothetical protein